MTTFPAGPEQRAVSRTEQLIAAALAVLMVVLRVVAFLRYRFDSDEPQHLHVAWGWTAGLLQYRDVFDNHAPLFHMAAAPLLQIVGERADVLLYMRAPMLILWGIVVAVTWIVARRLYSPRVALWSTILLTLFPTFFLKSLEFRTDNLWNAFWMLSVVVLFGVTGITPLRLFLAGLLLGAAMSVSMKTPLLLITLAVAGAINYWMTFRERSAARIVAIVLPLLIGAAIVPSIIIWYFHSVGAWPDLVYCVLTFNELVKCTRSTLALWTPRVLYVPLMIVLLRVSWRYRPAGDDDLARWRHFFAVATAVFFATLVGFWILISPRDLLPFLPFLSIFAVAAILRHVPRPVLVFVLLAALSVWAIWYQTQKFENRTDEFITMENQVLRLTRPGEMVMDYKGETIFRGRPFYYIFELITRNAMQRGLIRDTVPEAMVTERCYVAGADGLFWPPRARAFLNAHFIDLGRLRAAGQWLQPDGSFMVGVPGPYVILTKNGQASGMLDGTPFVAPRMLAVGQHTFISITAGERLAFLWAPAYARGFSPFHLQDLDF